MCSRVINASSAINLTRLTCHSDIFIISVELASYGRTELKNGLRKKPVRIRSYSGPYFPVFSPNVGKCGPA